MAVKLHILDGSGWMQQRGAKIGIGTDISGPYMWLGMADDVLLHPGFAPTPGGVERYGDDEAGKVV